MSKILYINSNDFHNQAGHRCVQEAAAILGPQNRTQGRCEPYCPSLNIFKISHRLSMNRHCPTCDCRDVDTIG